MKVQPPRHSRIFRSYRRPSMIWVLVSFIGVGLVMGSYHGFNRSGSLPVLTPAPPAILTRHDIAGLLSEASHHLFKPKDLPHTLTVAKPDGPLSLNFEYTLQTDLQEAVEDLMNRHDPEFGAFAALDPSTGRILALVSHTKDPGFQDQNLALRSSFPSASIFKVVTAAAAISQHGFRPESIVAFNGRDHSLSRTTILEPQEKRLRRQMTLRDAFSKSVNTVFGRIGAHWLGQASLNEYALRFAFNQNFDFDLPLDPGRADIPEDLWGLAQSASGFTLDTRMSPLQGALIAASIAQDGSMMAPFLVDQVTNDGLGVVYAAEPREMRKTVTPLIAAELRELMQATVHSGTSRGSFRGFFKHNWSEVEAGGKTGSLTGDNPKGKHDWFIGYGRARGKSIAVAALTIHTKYWKVKSSYLARRAMEVYFRPMFATTPRGRHMTSVPR